MSCCEKCKNDYTKDRTAMMNGDFCLNKGECMCHHLEPDMEEVMKRVDEQVGQAVRKLGEI